MSNFFESAEQMNAYKRNYLIQVNDLRSNTDPDSEVIHALLDGVEMAINGSDTDFIRRYLNTALDFDDGL